MRSIVRASNATSDGSLATISRRACGRRCAGTWATSIGWRASVPAPTGAGWDGIMRTAEERLPQMSRHASAMQIATVALAGMLVVIATFYPGYLNGDPTWQLARAR